MSKGSATPSLRRTAIVQIILYSFRAVSGAAPSDLKDMDALCRHIQALAAAFPVKQVIEVFSAMQYWAQAIKNDGLTVKLGNTRREAEKVAKSLASRPESPRTKSDPAAEVLITLLKQHEIRTASLITAAALLQEIAKPKDWMLVRLTFEVARGERRNVCTLRLVGNKRIVSNFGPALDVPNGHARLFLEAFSEMTANMAGALPDIGKVHQGRNRPATAMSAPQLLGYMTSHDRICITTIAIALFGAVQGGGIAPDKTLQGPPTRAIELFLRLHFTAKHCHGELPNAVRFALVLFLKDFLQMPRWAHQVDQWQQFVSSADWGPLNQQRLNQSQLALLEAFALKLGEFYSLDEAHAGLKHFAAMAFERRREVFGVPHHLISQHNLPLPARHLWGAVRMLFG